MSIRRGLSRISLFKRRMFHVRVTFLLRSRGVSVTYLYSYGISLSCVWVSRRMCYVRVTYVWRMKCTRDVSTAYVLRSILICGVSVLYHLLFKIYVKKRLYSLCSCIIRTLLLGRVPMDNVSFSKILCQRNFGNEFVFTHRKIAYTT